MLVAQSHPHAVVLTYPFADGLHPVDEGREVIDCGGRLGRIYTYIPKGSQALDEAPYLHVINATVFKGRIEHRYVGGLWMDSDSILGGDLCQMDF